MGEKARIGSLVQIGRVLNGNAEVWLGAWHQSRENQDWRRMGCGFEGLVEAQSEQLMMISL